MRPFDRRTTSSIEREVVAALRRLRGSQSPEDRARVDEFVPRAPLKVQIQTTTRCNAACLMCPYPDIAGDEGFEHQRMSKGLYRRIIAQLRSLGIERLSLFLMNEPLLDPRIDVWITHASVQLPATTLGLFTNASTLSAERARRLARAGLDELCVSVHGFEKETYESVMKGLSFERVTSNLRDVRAALGRGDLGALRVHMIAGDDPRLRSPGDGSPVMPATPVLRKAFSNERALNDLSPGMASSRTPTAGGAAVCQRPFVKLYVLADGTCVLCNCDWRRSAVVGRLEDRDDAPTIADIWGGPTYRAIREQHLRGRFDADLICDRCDYSRTAPHA